MIKVPDKQIAYFDVDDTLVIWPVGGQPKAGCEHEYITVNDNYGDVLLKPHKAHIAAIKAHKARGHLVVVWSQGGSDWAENVVRTLQLEQYVDYVMPKPNWFYDDLPSHQFMSENNRIYKDNE